MSVNRAGLGDRLFHVAVIAVAVALGIVLLVGFLLAEVFEVLRPDWG